ncbi:LOW QUALITY PROTEIN: ankyrin repeat and LEM domain-containing protein 1-like [Thomomys bottae]
MDGRGRSHSCSYSTGARAGRELEVGGAGAGPGAARGGAARAHSVAVGGGSALGRGHLCRSGSAAAGSTAAGEAKARRRCCTWRRELGARAAFDILGRCCGTAETRRSVRSQEGPRGRGWEPGVPGPERGEFTPGPSGSGLEAQGPGRAVEGPGISEQSDPAQVATTRGCCRALEFLLSQGQADGGCGVRAEPGPPADRSSEASQDGLRPVDLVMQLGHLDCARILRDRGLWAAPGVWSLSPSWPTASLAGLSVSCPLSLPGFFFLLPVTPDPSICGSPCATPVSAALQTQLGQASQDVGLEADPGAHILSVTLEVANQDGASLVDQDCSSSASFVTAVEVSGAENPAQDRTAPAASPLRVTNCVDHAPHLAPAVVAGQEAELSANLQALTLASPEHMAFQPPFCFLAMPDGSPAHSSPNFFLQDDQTSISMEGHTNVAALWLTEDEESTPGGWEPVLSCQPWPISAISDLELLQVLQGLGTSPGPITPFIWPYYLQILEEAHTASGPDFSGHSPELAETLRTSQADEDSLAQQFEWPDPTKRWWEGTVKSSFTYLLLDPREMKGLLVDPS